ncbi:hypothetical protein PUNSTDRAFT_134388 [Punctularia strigosozonata HHB-11173 SS5]|uniref:uncharacterized protein n=1 Tax=Punctularia strigosozonata (strain HHB-11173) TaxID=741275 RepID=UPI000441732B|nr:uncharacterized protein PUNSTDRAFT_134388 [Punctularia strigosozonata HHB-11173 SS5]EIN09226.1 hypothetical protein PUNSTDRAFT_134388 [Punctularia strigosozonata HHB-11173 SS5]
MINLQTSFLGSMSVVSHILDLRYSDPSYPLQVVARRFTPKPPTSSGDNVKQISLLLAHAVGLSTEHYIPFIKRLFEACNEARPHDVHIRSLWVVDSPNHGDAALLNTSILETQFSSKFPCKTYSEAITQVVQHLLSPEERLELIGLGHSAGSGVIVGTALDCPSPFKYHIFIEPGFWTAAANPIWDVVMARLQQLSKYRKPSWPTIKEAMNDLTQQKPYSTFSAEVLDLMQDTSFVESPQGGVTTKTSISREMASMNSYDEGVVLSELAVDLSKSIPTYMLQGERRDFWPKPLNSVIEATVSGNSASMRSVQVIPVCSHYPPQENVGVTAKMVLDILISIQSSAQATRL